MRKVVKGVAFLLAALVIIAGALGLAVGPLSERKRHRVVDVAVAPVAYAEGETALTRGKYLFQSRGCAECHGENAAGREVINEPNGFYIKSPNISPGSGSVVKDYKEVDWVRSIRHGVSPQKHALFLMPSADYNRMTNTDVAAVIAYVRALPPATGTGADIRLPLIVQALYVAGEVKDDAELINHSLPPATPVAEGQTPEHGAYVVQMCKGCHGDGLSGGSIPGTPPEWPPAANLTSGTGSAMPKYDSVDKFAGMLRTGKRPDGSAVSTVMPFATLRNLNDTDVGGLYAYLKTVPARPAGQR
ncbi:MAG: c-type cytochrome [Betaproteobacteria bacterium]